ncbi:hypothetical protein PKNFJJPA_00095 [Salmonella phage vB_SenAc_BPS6]|uniref:Tail spike TSP1/Gp66 N-terminal domain-containing protein n=8 Tax=Kuttervirus TaxID=2169536 RepID=A0A7T8IUV1_9CAUD|nr:tail protein [Salmonella phage SFP10]YP_009880733.1 tail protein [Salmonella phage S118]YP_009888121.1 tail protein [Salmonella phage aagejoakim]AXC40516.1 tail spike 4 [Salmonella phage S115]AXC40878.1 tail spike 4 [Salmonella phage S117]QIQ62073.1 hypothetical protein kage_5 [Salmonella phage kage]QKE54815.1 hypothetical protein AC4HA11_1580 [Escherichia phage vB_EcoA_4HA11]QQO87050.1 hypothetical protein PKNFJJPA_00095 [Salmonella phage vB_SenAc_BPS6]QQO89012.1 hypothetical protein AA
MANKPTQPLFPLGLETSESSNIKGFNNSGTIEHSPGAVMTFPEDTEVTGLPSSVRYNPDSDEFEGYYENGGWLSLGGGGIRWETLPHAPSSNLLEGRGYLINNTTGASTVVLPPPTRIGDSVTICDAYGKFATYPLTVSPSGNNLYGSTEDMAITTDNVSATFTWSGPEQGWVITSGVGLGQGRVYSREIFTQILASETSAVTLNTPPTIVDVYADGKRLAESKYSLDGNVITFSPSLPASTELQVIEYTPIQLGNGGDSSSSTITWVYNGGSAIGGETEITLDVVVDDVPAIDINGSRQYKNLGFTFDPLTSKITLAQELDAEDEVVVIINGTPNIYNQIDYTLREVARVTNVKDTEVVYFSVGAVLSGYKVIYDKITQRSYFIPELPTGTTAVSLSSSAVLVHSAGSVDLGALAVSREEYVTLAGTFDSGAVINTKNELLTHTDGKYRWDGTLPKTVAAGSTPATTGGVGSGAWLSVGDATARQWVANNYINSKFEKFGSFLQGSVLTTNEQALVDSSGLFWVKYGAIQSGGYTVAPGTVPDYPDFYCVGYLTDYDWQSVTNWGADNNYSIADKIGVDAVDAINLAGYHAEKRAELFGSQQVVMVPAGTYLLDKTTLVEGTAHGLTIYRNQEVMIFLRNNVTFIGDGDATLLYVADGVVERNKENGGTKGFVVFGDGIREIQNAYVHDMLIDENGDNNLVPPLNWSGAQAHCPAVACYEGSNGVTVSGVNVKNAPGANVMVFQEAQAAFNSYNTRVENCNFYRVADAVTGNSNLIDHSSIRIHSDGYVINNVKCIQPTMSDMCTVFECHGNGIVDGCITKKARYPFLKANDGATSTSIVTFTNNVCEDAGSALVLDTVPNVTTVARFIGNTVTLRSEKQVIGYPNTAAFTTQQPSVLSSDPTTINAIIYSANNNILQKNRAADWTTEQKAANVAYDLDYFKEVVSENNTFSGFWGCVRLGKQKTGATFNSNDSFVSCGTNGSPQLSDNTAIRFTNKFANDYLVHLDEMHIKWNMTKCQFGGVLGLLQQAAGVTVGVVQFTADIKTDRWMHPALGIAPLSVQDYYFNIDVYSDVNTSEPLYGYAGIHGQINVDSPTQPYVKQFYKYKPNTQNGWWFKGILATDTTSVPDRPFGNASGDRYDVIAGASNIFGYRHNGTTWDAMKFTS